VGLNIVSEYMNSVCNTYTALTKQHYSLFSTNVEIS